MTVSGGGSPAEAAGSPEVVRSGRGDSEPLEHEPLARQPLEREPPATPPPGGPPAAVSPRRYDPLAVVVATVAVGVLVAALHHPRSGMWVAAGGLAAAAALRLVLSPRNAGLLVVRSRRLDVVVLAGLAIALAVLAAVTPFPPGSA